MEGRLSSSIVLILLESTEKLHSNFFFTGVYINLNLVPIKIPTNEFFIFNEELMLYWLRRGIRSFTVSSPC